MPLSKHNSSLTEELIRFQKENQYLERKGRATKPSKIANEIIGMLNAGGGTLVYGIADDGAVENLESKDEMPLMPADMSQYRTLAFDFIAPIAFVEMEEVYLDSGELIMLFHVDHDYESLYQRKDTKEEEVF